MKSYKYLSIILLSILILISVLLGRVITHSLAYLVTSPLSNEDWLVMLLGLFILPLRPIISMILAWCGVRLLWSFPNFREIVQRESNFRKNSVMKITLITTFILALLWLLAEFLISF